MQYEKLINREGEQDITDFSKNNRYINAQKVSAYELPTSKDSQSTYTIISEMNYQNDWIQGKIDKTYISLNYYLQTEQNYYKALVNDNSYRMLIHKYNQDSTKGEYIDVGNGDIFYIDDSVEFITIAIYKYENRRIIENHAENMWKDIQNGLKFSLEKVINLNEHNMDKELLSGETNIESLSNSYNYRKGWFKSWGGAFENSEGSLCTRNFYKVDGKPYIFNTNDSRITLTITEYDANGKWLKYNAALKNGGIFIKQPTTSYIGLTIRSQKWGVDLYTLFENGLIIDLANEQYIGKTETINISNASFSNINNWKAGSYLYETGEFVITNNKICYDHFCQVGEEYYVVHLPGGYMKMSILELDQDGKVIYNNELQSGQKWKKRSNTDKIAITVYGNGKSFTIADYKNSITNYPTFGLEKYIRYTHNTLMKDITAGEYVNHINVGWNLGNSLDSKSANRNDPANLKQELNWGSPYITKDLIDYVAIKGFNTIRIPVTWYYNTSVDETGSIKVSDEWMNRVQDVVDYAIANNMYVILNAHHEQPIIYTGTDDTSMKQVLKNAKELWGQIAEHFKTYDEHLSFEAYNEVDNIERSWNYSDKAAAQMNELNQVFVDTVRGTGENNSRRILVIPTLLDGADSRFYSAFRMPIDYVSNKIAVQVHIYTKKFNQNINSDFSELKGFSDRIKAPIMIGEFGTTISYPLLDLRPEQASNFVARAAQYGIKSIWWDNGSDYKIIDRRDYLTSNMEMINALLEGSTGIGYIVEKEVVLNSPMQFVYLTPNIKTGELYNTYWGTMTTNIEGSGIPVQEGTTCSLSIKAVNGAASVWLQRLLFYDANGVLLQSGNEIQSKYYLKTIPEGAAFIRASFNSPTVNISLNDYKRYLDNGYIELSVCFFHSNDVKRIQLPITPYV
ncbi:glycoside hydrolase family 5 protein [Anaeromicropila herbilytica]|uniref:Glycoside hydrolase family 5 domain-containing protein n=1 Tax=Anaeromicropila herbilytica TaxID=2785025 RepID=A0A7R7EHV0_9FIRM|nr:glycoside hydrolase family 5 protein [Anaeromicropila herbilytica]BCN29025.1 hypothetical protein bsdtb5_03200 [Anaeromicropila herbilytica]